MEVHLLEAFYGGSHASWANGLRDASEHSIKLITLSDHHWKWRMNGGAISLLEQIIELPKPDVYLCTDMMDLALFRGILPPDHQSIPIIVYFHENQLTYPWSPEDQDPQSGRDLHYAFTNFTSALAADAVWFNSAFHRDQFLEELTPFLNQLPDHTLTHLVKGIRSKSEVVPVGIDFTSLQVPSPMKEVNRIPVILWNHRWEYDKNADEFFEGLKFLQEQDIPFQLVVLGEERQEAPACFAEAKLQFEEEIIHWGFVRDRRNYASLLWKADILPMTAIQEFFGISLFEAMYCETYPLVPKRLVYPEHLADKHLQFEGELGPALKELIASGRWKNDVHTFQEQAVQCSWQKLIPMYDQLIHRAERKPFKL